MKHRWLMNLLVALVLVVPVALMGCQGSDGSDGADGATGAPGADGADGAPGADGADGAPGADGQDGLGATDAFHLGVEQVDEIEIDVTDIAIASPPVIRFRITDAFGRAGVALGSAVDSRGRLSWIRFSMAKLVAGADGDPDDWIDYVNGERVPENLVDNGDGTYVYTFAKDLGDYDAAVAYDPNLTHRLAIQSSGGSWEAINLVIDFVPAQLPGPSFTLPNTRDVVTTDACNECHGKLTIHGSRYETKYCVVCHNPTLDEANFVVMAHGIHGASIRETPYKLGNADFSGVGFPQDVTNCRKCHQGADGDQWKTRPSMVACGSCHDTVDFANGVNHITQTTNEVCHLCHNDAAIELVHLTDNATPNNPQVPQGAVNFVYEIASVTVNGSDEAVVTFRILANGTPAVFNTYSAGAALLAGFTGSPSFLLAWAESQDGIATPADYNNLGNAAGQPTSVSISNVWSGSEGSLSGPDGSGYYTATITGAPFPSGASMRTVALQGYFTQVSPALSRHTVAAIKTATGDTPRRAIVDDAKCASCHEWFEGHGGNRVRTTQVCATCHVPNLSSSSRTKDVSSYVHGTNSNTDAAVDALGYDSLAWPETTNNFKDMIHGIHASHFRENHFEFVRVRSGNAYYYDWSHVTFPGELNHCETCHLSDTYLPASVPANALWSNVRTTTGDPNETQADVVGARNSVPNSTDLVNTPISSACAFCHDSAAAASHMELNGGAIGWERGEAVAESPVESCIVCHGEGKIADVEAAHGGD